MIRRLKHYLGFWRTDLVITVNLLIFAAFAGVFGGLLFGLAGAVGGVLTTMVLIHFLDVLP